MVTMITQFAWLLMAFPVLSFFVIVGLTWKRPKFSAAVAMTTMALALGYAAAMVWAKVMNPATVEIVTPLLDIHNGIQPRLHLEWGLLIDPLSAVMCFIVTLIGFLVMLYSAGYMKGDAGYSRYYAYLSFFVFSMLGLVLSNNYLQTYVFWELVGFCSYLLVGFWFYKPAAAAASKKAFITNRWGDFGFLVGITGLFTVFGTFNFLALNTAIVSQPAAVLPLLALLVLLGPAAKSAQVPFHVWLPDAMEGPTPVSALIHAATMVAAGVYLVARGFVLFASVPQAMTMLAYGGAVTAVMAATLALVQRDIKRILAYSTLSQLGYMMMALGMGSMTAGMFHLTTHAFFKALLFLGAGSVIHALHEQDIFKMGGLFKKMPVTAWTFVIGSLALAGVFPLAGFWSKDEILTVAYHHHFMLLFVLGTMVAFLTSLYMFRLIFLAFGGSPKTTDPHHPVHESPWVMTVPLVVLAVFSVVAGFVNTPLFDQIFGGSFSTFIYYQQAHHPEVNILVAGVSSVFSLLGIFIAWLFYQRKIFSAQAVRDQWPGICNVLDHKYYFDEVYAWLYRGILEKTGRAFNFLDHRVIDGMADGSVRLVRKIGVDLRVLQTGRLQHYVLVIVVAVMIMVIWRAQ